MTKIPIKVLKNALIKSYGVIHPAVKLLEAKGFKVERANIYKRIQRNQKLKDAIEESQNKLLDIAEFELGKLIASGDRTAITFLLKTKGRKRGYVEKVEQQHSSDQPIKLTIETKPYNQIKNKPKRLNARNKSN